MRILTGSCAIAALILSATAALAVSGPSGKYAFVSMEMCEAQLTVTKDFNGKVTDVNLTKAGMMAGGTGYITFTPTSASAGNATVTGAVLIESGALRVGSNGFNWHQNADNQPSTPYSFTATTFTFGGQVYRIVGGNLAGGIYKNVYLVRRDDTVPGNANCIISISATKQ